MPFTPYHFGPGFFIGLLFLNFIDFPTFLIANVIVDIEPIFILIFHLNLPLHGFFHSFLGGTIIALILAVIMIKIREFFNPIMSFFKIEQETSSKKILIASLLGIYIHILLDSLIYTDIKPLFPLNFNPFYITATLSGSFVEMICIWCFLAGGFVYLIRLIKFLIKSRRDNQNFQNRNEFNGKTISKI